MAHGKKKISIKKWRRELERADYFSNQCVRGACNGNECGGGCDIVKRMERYKQLVALTPL